MTTKRNGLHAHQWDQWHLTTKNNVFASSANNVRNEEGNVFSLSVLLFTGDYHPMMHWEPIPCCNGTAPTPPSDYDFMEGLDQETLNQERGPIPSPGPSRTGPPRKTSRSRSPWSTSNWIMGWGEIGQYASEKWDLHIDLTILLYLLFSLEVNIKICQIYTYLKFSLQMLNIRSTLLNFIWTEN